MVLLTHFLCIRNVFFDTIGISHDITIWRKFTEYSNRQCISNLSEMYRELLNTILILFERYHAKIKQDSNMFERY